MEKTLERLQKAMASAGIASRRKCEEYIVAGRVKVNGKVITELGFKVSANDKISFDNQPVFKESLVYYVMNKPTGYLSTVSDKLGRRTVMDLFDKKTLADRIYPVGRLDYDTSGVLLFTNDGALAYKLTRSSNNISKEYQVRCDGIITQEAVSALITGVVIDGIKTKRATVSIKSYDRVNNSTLLTIIISEGRNRQVRKMMDAVGFKVKKLKRLSFAGITSEGLQEGEYRLLKPHEIKILYSL